MQRVMRTWGLLFAIVLLVACGGSGSPASTVSSSVPASAGQQGNQQLSNPGGTNNQPNRRQTVPRSSTEGAAGTAAPAAGMPLVLPESAQQSHSRGTNGNETATTGGSTDPRAPQADPSSPRNEPPYDSTFYQNYGVNPFVVADEDSLSTFAMDIDTAAYTVMRRYLSDGALPDPDSVRPEEYLNFFDYRYPQPDAGSDFKIYTEMAPSPWGGQGYELLQVGIQGRVIEAADRLPTSLTFVIDVSGSMEQEGRLETVKQALTLLVNELREDDQIGIVVYGSDAHSVLPPTSGQNKQRILRAIEALVPTGSTNVEAGLDIGFAQADEAFARNNTNMILLCSDGVANNGVTDPEALLAKYQRYTSQGIKLSTFGFGMGNYNDVLMERLANAGNGFYSYIDTLQEAERVFVQNLAGTLQLIGRDAKVQVEFNPEVVSRYRLIGYENRDVADRDFRNDAVDAGEVGAGHSVTALYEIKRFSDVAGPIATVRLRYHKVPSQNVAEEAQVLASDDVHMNIDDATPRFKLATSVAQYAELLRYSEWTRGAVLEDVIGLAEEARRGFQNDSDVAEFTELLERATRLAPARSGVR